MAKAYNSIKEAELLFGVAIPQGLLDMARGIIDNYTPFRWEDTTAVETFNTSAMPELINRGNSFHHGGFGFRGRGGLGFPDFDHFANGLSLWIKYPITSITSFTIDGNSLTEDTDYEVNEDIGQIRFINIPSIGSTNQTLIDDMIITYVYGYDKTDKAYNVVRGVEAQIALYFKKNPLGWGSKTLDGDSLVFGVVKDPIQRMLSRVPRPVGIRHVLRGVTP